MNDQPMHTIEPLPPRPGDFEAVLATAHQRRRRRALVVAAGAAVERLYLSYPRIELREARPRVPSFYGLDVMRAITGRVPSHEALEAQAARGVARQRAEKAARRHAHWMTGTRSVYLTATPSLTAGSKRQALTAETSMRSFRVASLDCRRTR